MAEEVTRYPDSLAIEESSSNKWKLIIGAIVLIGALGYFAFMAFESATVYFYTVSEMKEQEATREGKVVVVRVSGKLVCSVLVPPG